MNNIPTKHSIAALWVAALVVSLVVGCAPQTRFDASVQPDWVTGSSQKYAGPGYFVGKGEAAALDVAAKNAREALADTLSTQTGDLLPTVLDELAQKAEVVDAWQDDNTSQHYALVVLKRATAPRLLRARLAKLDAETQQFIKAATQGTDPLQQIRSTHDALATQPVRADLLLALQSLDEAAKADSTVWSTTEMQTHLKSLLSSIDVAPRTHGDSQLGSAVVRGLDAAGYLSKRAQPQYVLSTTLQRSGMKWEQGRFVEQGTLSVELLNQQQKVVGKAQWPLTAQAEERTMLDKEMMNEVTNTLREQMAETVLGLTAE